MIIVVFYMPDKNVVESSKSVNIIIFRTQGKFRVFVNEQNAGTNMTRIIIKELVDNKL